MLILDDRAIQQSTAEQGYIVQHILGSELYGPLCVMTSANKAPTNDDDAWFPLTSPEIYIKNHEQSVFHVQKTPTPFSFSHCLSTTAAWLYYHRVDNDFYRHLCLFIFKASHLKSYGKSKLAPKLAESWPKIGRKLAESWPKVDPNLAHIQLDVSPQWLKYEKKRHQQVCFISYW